MRVDDQSLLDLHWGLHCHLVTMDCGHHRRSELVAIYHVTPLFCEKIREKSYLLGDSSSDLFIFQLEVTFTTISRVSLTTLKRSQTHRIATVATSFSGGFVLPRSDAKCFMIQFWWPAMRNLDSELGCDFSTDSTVEIGKSSLSHIKPASGGGYTFLLVAKHLDQS